MTGRWNQKRNDGCGSECRQAVVYRGTGVGARFRLAVFTLNQHLLQDGLFAGVSTRSLSSCLHLESAFVTG